MIFITGDTHGGADSGFRRFNTKNFPQGKQLTKKDYVIILGDCALIWSYPNSKRYKEDLYWQNWFHEKPWTTLFIDGNHENHNLLSELENIEMFGDKVGKVNDSIYHLKRGRIYTIDDKTFFTMGGAESYDKENRILGQTYWKNEEPSYKEQAEGIDVLEKYHYNVDYVLTHNGPRTINRYYMNVKNMPTSYKIKDQISDYFDYLYLDKKIKFKKWFYGHWHDNWKLDNFHMLYKNIIKIQ